MVNKKTARSSKATIYSFEMVLMLAKFSRELGVVTLYGDSADPTSKCHNIWQCWKQGIRWCIIYIYIYIYIFIKIMEGVWCFEIVAAQLLFACGGHLGKKAYSDLCSTSHTAGRRINLWLQVSIWRC